MERVESTLLALVATLDGDPDTVVEEVAEMLGTGKVELTGNFRGLERELAAQALARNTPKLARRNGGRPPCGGPPVSGCPEAVTGNGKISRAKRR